MLGRRKSGLRPCPPPWWIKDRILWSSESCRFKSKSVIMSDLFEEFHFPMFYGAQTVYYGTEIEIGPLDGISTLFVWFGEHSSYIGLYRHHGQTETIWSSVLGQGYTSRAPALRPCWLAMCINWFSISPEPSYYDRKWKPIFDPFRAAREIFASFSTGSSAGLYIMSYKPFSISTITIINGLKIVDLNHLDFDFHF